MSLAAVFARAAARFKTVSRCTPRVRSLTNTRWTPNASRRSFDAFRRGLQARSFSASGYNSQVCSVLGGQWGDEGKGKLVDILAKEYDMIGRFNGGANAGHTLVVGDRKFAFHLLPCGMLYPDKTNVIGNGVVMHIPTLLKELSSLDEAGIDYTGRLMISDRAHLVIDAHQVIDGMRETALGDGAIGTTKKGIGPAYASKATRNGLRVGDLFQPNFQQKYLSLVENLQSMYGFDYDTNEELARFDEYRNTIGDMVIDTVHYVNSSIRAGKTLLAEGANAALLDVDFGTYPYVTSSPTTAGGICTGLGIAPTKIDTCIGVVKAYTTRVGAGPFPTELEDAIGQEMRDVGHEYGTTTGRPRRCGWLDIPVVQYSHMINNYKSINITKLDVLSGLDEIKIGVAYKINGEQLPVGLMPSSLQGLAAVEVEYETMQGWKCDISKATRFEDLPGPAQAYLRRIEELVGVEVSWVGVGPGRLEMATQGFEAIY